MNKKKKIIATIVILASILLAFFGGQTFSKYITEVKGEGTANVAKWSFKVNDSEEKIQKINLASTINNQTLINNKIAPGTKGSFDIIVDGTEAEVGIDYQIKFINEQNKPQNLIFKYNNKEYKSVTELTEDLSGRINANDEEKKITKTIEWEWPYETGKTENEVQKNDKIDTENGKQISTYNFEISVTGTQIVPTE